MDRYLISGALALLLLQTAFLFESLQPRNASGGQTGTGQMLIGELVKRQESVKRKSANSIVWDEPRTNDQLYAYDSILTLDDSTAELKLKGDVNLRVHENTLVVLEPPSSDKLENLKVRFQRGLLRSQNKGQAFQVGSLGWTIEAKAGSDLSLRAVGDEKVELEVEAGDVELRNTETNEVQSFSRGQKLSLEKEKVSDVQSVDSELSFLELPPSRIYSHHFPISVELKWTPGAKTIEILRPNSGRESLVAPASLSTHVSFEPGTYVLNLRSDDRVSKAYVLELKPAPQIKYLSPLPRDRLNLEKEYAFSWFPIDGVNSYYLHFDPKDKSTASPTTVPAKTSYTDVKFLNAGEFNWSVSATDNDGITIPPYYSLPVYFIKNPLKAPVLRQPAKSNTPDQGQNSYLDKLLNLLLPQAHAQNTSRQIVLSWFPVEGANYYVIELSEAPDFLHPVLVKKVRTEELIWSEFLERQYYWRVAAGTDDGQMGVFSDVGQFNVRDLKSLSSQDLAPGVKYIERPLPKATPTPTIIPTVTPTPTPTPMATPTPETTAPPIRNSLKVGFVYGSINQSQDDFDAANFLGFIAPDLTYARTLKLFKSYYVAEVSYRNFSIEPKDESIIQPKLDSALWQVKFNRHQADGFGLTARNLIVFERKDLEELQLTDVTTLGFFHAWDSMLDADIIWRPSVELGYGNSYSYIEIGSDFYYAIDTIQAITAQFDIQASFGGDKNHSGRSVNIGFGYNWRW